MFTFMVIVCIIGIIAGLYLAFGGYQYAEGFAIVAFCAVLLAFAVENKDKPFQPFMSTVEAPTKVSEPIHDTVTVYETVQSEQYETDYVEPNDTTEPIEIDSEPPVIDTLVEDQVIYVPDTETSPELEYEPVSDTEPSRPNWRKPLDEE